MTDHVLDGDGNRREIYAGTYVGQLSQLKGETAILRDSPLPGCVEAQFDGNKNYPLYETDHQPVRDRVLLTRGWHTFAVTDFLKNAARKREEG